MGRWGGNQAYGGVVGMQGRTRVQGRGVGTSSHGGMRAQSERDESGADLTGQRGGTVRELAVKVKTVTVTQYTESLLLGSFLESREPSISSVALEYFLKTTISHPNPSAPPHCLFAAVTAAFSFISPDHQLRMGWTILGIFVDRFETLSVEWRRSFAEGFFTLSRRPLLRPRGRTEPSTRESELEQILTWEYFNEEDQERALTDSEFSGLDWMAMAWSLHLSEQFQGRSEGSGQANAQLWNLSGPAVNEEFVLRALCKLINAAPLYQLTPIIPKLCEFLQWFDDTELPEYRGMISTRIREAVHMQQELQNLHRFHKFQCMWYI